MKNQEIRFKSKLNSYSIIIGNNTFNQLSKKIEKVCPKTNKIALIIDKNVPRKISKILISKIKKYDLSIISFSANEKSKSFKSINVLLNKLLSKNLNRNDLIISVGGGITGDVAGFVASILKRGVNFINVPTTLLAQVDSAIGGKTGVNSKFGKNLIGTFYQPKLVIIDTIFLKSLPRREMICGYAEILKHAIIKDEKFFRWLKNHSKYIFSKQPDKLIYAIKKSCQIKIYFVRKDVNEKGLRMKLNFGHTFGHAIEIKNNYSKRKTHGEAVLSGIMLASRLSVVKNICKIKVLKEIEEIYKKNKIDYTFNEFSNPSTIKGLIPYLKNDKKNNDNKINFILLKKIGSTSTPNSFKMSIKELKNSARLLINSNF